MVNDIGIKNLLHASLITYSRSLIEVHAASCPGRYSPDPTVPSQCPLCNQAFPADLIEGHAAYCAEGRQNGILYLIQDTRYKRASIDQG